MTQELIGRRMLMLVVLAAFLSGCGGGDKADPEPQPTRGTLTLTVNGVKGNADVAARNARGAMIALTEGANTLAVGTYTLAINSIRRSRPIVDSLLTGAADRTEVTITGRGAQRTSVTYTEQPGRLWIPAGTTLHGYGAAQLGAGTGAPGSVTITGAGASPFNAAFDLSGNLWVADCGGNALLFYTAQRLDTGGSATPDATINTTATDSLACPVGIAFDDDGGLWVSNFEGNTLARYAAEQLADAIAAGSSAFAPQVIIGGAALDEPYGHAFDVDGRLWVANNGANTLIKYTANQLARSGNPTPASATNDKASGRLDAPRSPAFDADGDLWVASRNTGEVVRYIIDADGEPVPARDVALRLGGGVTPTDPTGLAFDNAGSLWVMDGENDRLLKYAADDITDGDGSADAATTIAGFGEATGVLFSFNPPPTELPVSR